MTPKGTSKAPSLTPRPMVYRVHIRMRPEDTKENFEEWLKINNFEVHAEAVFNFFVIELNLLIEILET